MLEIKTVINRLDNATDFDDEVNKALAEGWELVRRDVLQSHTENKYSMLYAELERETEPEEEELDDDDATTSWLLTRDPLNPYRCEKCNFKTIAPIKTGCPNCGRAIAVE